MSRLSGQHLLADTIDTSAAFATEDARRRAELDAALHPERAAMRANSERIRIAKAAVQPPSPQPSPEPKKEDPMPANDPTRTYSRPGCTRTLRSDNAKGVCSDRKKCGGTGAAPIQSQPDDVLMGEIEEAKKAPGKKKTAAPAITGGVEKLRLVAEALGFNADAVLDELAGEWLTTVGNQVREAAR